MRMFAQLLCSAFVMASAWVTCPSQEIQFEDVPVGHWVYDALKDGRNRGHFFGYPDGWFRGGRALTRYELAGVVNAFYQDVKALFIEVYVQTAPIRSLPGEPALETPTELTRSVATLNWLLQHRREIRRFAVLLTPH